MNRARIVTAAAALAVSCVASAQAPPLKVPQVSQKASVSQTVGLTEVSISYSRPSVSGRKVWGGLVPYDVVWRAGANENTTISFSSDVTFAGTKVPAGAYGLHMIPSAKEWTVILSREHEAWGSYDYDEKDDFLRATVTPEPDAFSEKLTYTLDDPGADAVKATLHWEKLKVSVPITVDTNAVVAESLRHQLKGAAQFSWQGWNQAAAWCVAHDTHLDQAAAWADRSLAMNENFQNLRTKAAILEKKGDAAQAAALRQKALGLATEQDMNVYGYQLLGQKKVDEAIAVFEQNAKKHPESWNTHDSLAEAYATKGDKAKATALYQKARSMTKDPSQHKRIDVELSKLRG